MIIIIKYNKLIRIIINNNDVCVITICQIILILHRHAVPLNEKLTDIDLVRYQMLFIGELK